MFPASYNATMQEKDLTILDFQSAVALAIKDPMAFEEYRLRVIEALIERAPERTQLHLQRLQWRIKQANRRSPNPFEDCVKLQKMVWHSASDRDEPIESLENPRKSAHTISKTLPKARVLAFRFKEEQA